MALGHSHRIEGKGTDAQLDFFLSTESSTMSRALEPEMVASILLDLRVQTSVPKSRGDRARSRPTPAVFYSPEWGTPIAYLSHILSWGAGGSPVTGVPPLYASSWELLQRYTPSKLCLEHQSLQSLHNTLHVGHLAPITADDRDNTMYDTSGSNLAGWETPSQSC